MSDSERTFSVEAYEWLRSYHGSCDSTALLIAFDAGRRQGQQDPPPAFDDADLDVEREFLS